MLAVGTSLRFSDVLEGFVSLGVPGSPAAAPLERSPGEPGTVIHIGGSAVIAPDTGHVAGPLFDAAGILTAELDLALVTEGHLAMDTDGHYARPDVFRLGSMSDRSAVWFGRDEGPGTKG